MRVLVNKFDQALFLILNKSHHPVKKFDQALFFILNKCHHPVTDLFFIYGNKYAFWATTLYLFNAFLSERI
jgi:hypothetical protein